MGKMAGTVELMLFLALVYVGWQLNEIRKISRACYVEISMARWENGRLVRAQDKSQRLSSLRREIENRSV